MDSTGTRAGSKLNKGAAGRKAGGPRKKALLHSVNAGLVFPICCIGRYLNKGRYAQRVSAGAPIPLASALEYLASEIMELLGNGVSDNKKTWVIPCHILLAIRNDEEVLEIVAHMYNEILSCP